MVNFNHCFIKLYIFYVNQLLLLFYYLALATAGKVSFVGYFFVSKINGYS